MDNFHGSVLTSRSLHKHLMMSWLCFSAATVILSLLSSSWTVSSSPLRFKDFNHKFGVSHDLLSPIAPLPSTSVLYMRPGSTGRRKGKDPVPSALTRVDDKKHIPNMNTGSLVNFRLFLRELIRPTTRARKIMRCFWRCIGQWN